MSIGILRDFVMREEPQKRPAASDTPVRCETGRDMNVLHSVVDESETSRYHIPGYIP